MDFIHYKNSFTKEALKIGHSAHTIKRCMDYAEVLFLNKLPIIYNTTHLSVLLGYKKEYRRKATLYPQKFYRHFDIQKRNGTKRQISEPLPSLKEIQLWILKNILYRIPISPFAKAYKPDISLVENLKFHKNQYHVFTLDLENFFRSIKRQTIESVFSEIGYSKLVAKLLSKLCTHNDTLPQGAPTSPYLSNLIFRNSDIQIANYCKTQKIRYTSYADNLSFSGNFDANKLLDKVTAAIESLNLKINPEKTWYMTSNCRQTVTGIVVNKKPQVPFLKRNELRKSMCYIRKFGIDKHKEYKEISQSNYLEHLLGKINFVLQINPKDMEFIGYKSDLMDFKKKQKRGKQNQESILISKIKISVDSY